MQKVAWPTMTVNSVRSTPSTCVKVAFSAMPVTMPGSAIGSSTRNEIVLRPKKRWRETAIAARVPSTIAIAVAPSPALSEVQRASRTPVLSKAFPNHSSVRPSIGQDCERDSLKA